MTRSGIALVAFRLVAAWLALSAIFVVFGLASLMVLERDPAFASMGLQSSALWNALVSIALTSGLALVVYACAPRWAKAVGGDDLPDPIVDRFAIAVTAFRIAGVFVLHQALILFESLIVGAVGGSQFDPRGTLVGLAFALLGISLVAWPEAWTRRRFGPTLASDAPTSALVQGIAFSILGVLFSVFAIPEVVEVLFPSRSVGGSLFGLGSAESESASISLGQLALPGLRLLLGLALFFGGARLARAWHRWRADEASAATRRYGVARATLGAPEVPPDDAPPAR